MEKRTEERLEQIANLLHNFFDNDADKVDLWLHTSNHLLGGYAPITFIMFGNEKKLLKFIEHQLSENELG